MTWFKKLFGKKKQKEPKQIDLGNGFSVDEEGNISGELEIGFSINGQKSNERIQINTDIEKLDAWVKKKQAETKQQEDNRLNPESCEREPNENEVKIAIGKIGDYLHSLPAKHHLIEELFNAKLQTIKTGYNNVVVSKKDFSTIEYHFNNHKRTHELLSQATESESKGEIDVAIQLYEEVLTIEYEGNDHSQKIPYDRLHILYSKQKDEENEKRILKLTIEKFGANTKLQRRLDKLNGIETTISLPTEAYEVHITEPTLGQQYEQAMLNIPEFNFYFDMSDDMNTMEYLYKHPEYTQQTEEKKLLFEIRDSLEELISRGAGLENEGKLDEAAKTYEEVIAHQAFLTTPYDRLIKIYSKAKLKKDEERVLTEAISHFKALREKRREYVVGLATKYGKLEFAEDRINQGKKITYFSGIFDLYNPYPIIDKWEIKLQKLLAKK